MRIRAIKPLRRCRGSGLHLIRQWRQNLLLSLNTIEHHLIVQVTLSWHHWRRTRRFCDVNWSLGWEVRAYSHTASKRFPTACVHSWGHICSSLCCGRPAVCRRCSYMPEVKHRSWMRMRTELKDVPLVPIFFKTSSLITCSHHGILSICLWNHISVLSSSVENLSSIHCQIGR